MQYLAALDYEHLDNGVFLTSLARSVSRQKNVRPIIIHGDSEYTERIIQTGVMREEATVRSIKDLNHRLIALLADEGVSTIGINGYQRELITLDGEKLSMDTDYLESLPSQSALLLSSLVYNKQTGSPQAVELSRFANFLKESLPINELFIFSASDTDEIFTGEEKPATMRWQELDKGYRSKYIPREFQNYEQPVRLTTARDFESVPKLDKTSLIE